MSKVSLIITILGNDRPGLVESLAALVARHGGSWLESRLAHLAHHFAGVLRVEIDEAKAGALTEALHGLADQGLELVVHADDAESVDRDQRLVSMQLVGQDRPGIVNEIARVLADHRVNVEELTTECTSAPTTGQVLFHARAMLGLPSDLQEDALRRELERIAGDVMVDIDLRQPEPSSK